eukprot:499592-Pyramimonas_sp.AAC.1
MRTSKCYAYQPLIGEGAVGVVGYLPLLVTGIIMVIISVRVLNVTVAQVSNLFEAQLSQAGAFTSEYFERATSLGAIQLEFRSLRK